ncbi:hypothetical protein BMF35_a1150 [Aurantiacibacter gangjinensis]|nr:hypothetical protein BMF35_a1150 [Aurantiacibacter gangjinensis]
MTVEGGKLTPEQTLTTGSVACAWAETAESPATAMAAVDTQDRMAKLLIRIDIYMLLVAGR